MGSWERSLLALFCLMTRCVSSCPLGFLAEDGRCVDEDECAEQDEPVCGNNSTCFNTNGSYYCQCLPGFKHSYGRVNFTGTDGQCEDVDECINDLHTCGLGGNCTNLPGSFRCDCNSGYINDVSGKHCIDVNECIYDLHTCGLGGNCTNLIGSFRCDCNSGYINDVRGKHCTEFDCSRFSAGEGSAPSHGALADLLSVMTNSCLTLSDQRAAGQVKMDGEAMLEKLFTATEAILSPGPLNSSDDVTLLLGTVENAIKLIGPQLKESRTRELETPDTEVEIAVQRGRTRPTGPIRLSTENATLDTDWTTMAGTGSYAGFVLAALLTLNNPKRYFGDVVRHDKYDVKPSVVVSVVGSNPAPETLSKPFNITFTHHQVTEESPALSHICMSWSESSTWSIDGCYHLNSNATHTVCNCKLMGSFGFFVISPKEYILFLPEVIIKGMSISLLCYMLCIVTFKFCRCIQGTRNTIHLHLCICLFVAHLILLAATSTKTQLDSCRLVSAMLHVFFLGIFTWMLLEDVQLYLMVVQQFNATIPLLYLFVTGYGIPIVIVIISAILIPEQYGADQYCWISKGNHIFWSFIGPVCFIILAIVLLFSVTAWKLVQKFNGFNGDPYKLQKIKAFVVTFIAQLCILSLVNVLRAVLYQKDTMVLVHVVTIFNSLQGSFVFVMHCLLSEQVRKEYTVILSSFPLCSRHKRNNDLSNTNPSGGHSRDPQSLQHIEEIQT